MQLIDRSFLWESTSMINWVENTTHLPAVRACLVRLNGSHTHELTRVWTAVYFPLDLSAHPTCNFADMTVNVAGRRLPPAFTRPLESWGYPGSVVQPHLVVWVILPDWLFLLQFHLPVCQYKQFPHSLIGTVKSVFFLLHNFILDVFVLFSIPWLPSQALHPSCVEILPFSVVSCSGNLMPGPWQPSVLDGSPP